MLFSSLRIRLIAVYVGLIVLGFGGLTLLAGQQLANNAYDDFGNNLHINALLLANQLLTSLEHESATAVSLVNAAAVNLNGQVTVFDRRGNIVLNSSAEQAALVFTDTYIIQADGAGTPTIYASAPIIEEDGQIGTVQIGVPLAVPETAVRQRWLVLGAAFAGFSGLGLAISLWLLTSLTRPLSRLQQTALKMAAGDLSQRVDPLSSDEIGAVGHAFNEMAEKVEMMLFEQQAFASNASHELRTPLTTIQLRTEWLQSGELDRKTTEKYITEIDKEVKRMTRLVEDLLLLSRLDARRLAVGEERIDLVRLWGPLEQEYAPKMVDKHIAMTLDLPQTALFIQTNLSHAQVVFRNLLDNAWKYTPENGRIAISVQQHGQSARVVIQDDGRGIAIEDLSRLGQRFFRGDKAHSRAIQGVGLGLSLVYSIMALYGGQLTITSPGVNLGTTAVVDWPLLPDAD